MNATAWSRGLEDTDGGTGVVSHAGYRFGTLHFACLPVTLMSFHLCPFALRAAFPPFLAGRYHCD